MAEDEIEMNENDMSTSSKVDFPGDNAVSLEEDPEDSDKDEGMSFSFGGSRGFEE